MQKTSLILAVIILIILAGGGYFIYHQKQNDAITELTTPPTSTPAQSVATSSFHPLGGFDSYDNLASAYAVDGAHAYYEGKIIDADPATLEVIKGSLKNMKGYITYKYARDLNAVYYEGIPLYGYAVYPGSASAFQPIENGSSLQSYGTDGKTVYFYSSPISGADPKTFKILWQTTWEGCPQTQYSKDATHVYLDSSVLRKSFVVQGADPATFESLVRGFGKDKRGYYEEATYLGPTMDLNKLTCGVG